MSHHSNAADCPTDSLLLRFAFGDLESNVESFVSTHVDSCPLCTRNLGDVRQVGASYSALPTPRLSGARFASMIETASREGRSRSGGRGWESWVRAAAVAGVAFTAGLWADRATGRDANDAASVADSAAHSAGTFLTDPSAAARIRGVSLVPDLDRAVERGGPLLVWVLETDPSPNVRLAALDALRAVELSATEWERIALVLTREPQPGLRMAVIDLLVVRGPDVMVPALETAARNDEDPSVRRRASTALGLT
jgi:hypothetical protein